MNFEELMEIQAWHRQPPSPAAAVQHERTRIAELIRQRAALLCDLPGPTPRRAVEELLRLAEIIDKAT